MGSVKNMRMIWKKKRGILAAAILSRLADERAQIRPRRKEAEKRTHVKSCPPHIGKRRPVSDALE